METVRSFRTDVACTSAEKVYRGILNFLCFSCKMAEKRILLNESVNYFNVAIKEEIELPDLNLDEYGEVDFSHRIKTEQGEKNQVEEPKSVKWEFSDLQLRPCFVNLHQGIDLNDISSCGICKKLKNTMEKQSEASESQDEELRSGTEKPYKCNECEQRFRQKSSLKRHFRIHSGEKPYKCNECEQRFRRKSSLECHLRIHSGEKPYKCNECEQRFRQKIHLKRHLRIHSGEKPYKCNECQQRFREKNSLKRHFRIHSGEKPYKCNECQQRFREKNTLKRHFRIHSGEKPYKCIECEQRFRQKSSLKLHLRRKAL